jgi:hypothetical protein
MRRMKLRATAIRALFLSVALGAGGCSSDQEDLFAGKTSTSDGGSGGCTSDADCAKSASGHVCDTKLHACGSCSTTDDACVAGSVCSAATLTCTPGCKGDADCAVAGSSKHLTCDPTTHQCKGCGADADCPLATLCDVKTSQCAPGCNLAHGCPGQEDCCDGQCSDTQSDSHHCGSCTVQCSADSACKAGKCGIRCDAGRADCNGKTVDACEVDLETDPDHCGECGVVCAGDHIDVPTCEKGVCGGACAAGFADCDGDKKTNGCETATGDDPANCGGCGEVCSKSHVTSATCAGGECTGACEAGYSDCDGDKQKNGCEAQTSSDPKNCGACGAPCSDANVAVACAAGQCTGACLGGHLDCDGDLRKNGCEVDPLTDPKACGGCGQPCADVNIAVQCTGGVCDGPCELGFADCNFDKRGDGCETNVATNPASCGVCGLICSSNHIAVPKCDAGVCDGACNAGFADCDGDKQKNGCEASTADDPDNCGGCGVVCSGNGVAARLCVNGACVGACAAGFADCDGDRQSNGCEVGVGGDPNNCGNCGRHCSNANIANPTCSGGFCTGACNPGTLDCDGDKQKNGCETLSASDVANCGGCGLACSASNVVAVACTGGVCSGACKAGYADCDGNKQTNGCETAIDSNIAACGGCGNACSSNHIAAQSCSTGVCNGSCQAGWTDCDGNKLTNGCESNTAADTQNCGACGVACSPQGMMNLACSNGACSGTCASGYADCNGNKQKDGCETNIGGDAQNCGACGKACSGNNVPSPTCGGGVCNGACAAGFADCDGNKQTNGCESPVASDVANCGGCGLACSANNVVAVACTAGQCSGACKAGFADCNGNRQTDGCEADLVAGAASCGACGVACSSNHVVAPVCSNGACTSACAAGWTDCDGNKQTNGCEVNTLTDPDNCGGCGVVCSSNGMGARTCNNGVCNGTCAAGFADCDGNKQANGCETNVGGDAQNCGACGKVCSGQNVPTPTCGGGVCNGACAAGFADCDGNRQTNGCETNVDSNVASCGGCGKSCSANHVSSPVCSGGVCAGACDAGYADCDGNRQTNGCEVALNTDVGNCGGCGVVCSTNNVSARTCTGGVCTGACSSGFADCDGNKQTNGCEQDIFGSATNCGACKLTCSSNNVPAPTCTGGVCTGACAAGFANCDANKLTNGCEVSSATDPANCGGCGIVCSSNHVAQVQCQGATCNGACDAGFWDCNNNKQVDGCESDPQTDVNNCGACGLSCSSTNMATRTCGSATCNGTCKAGYADCDGNKLTNGCETNTNTDAKNCGNCGNACPNGQSCANGACVTCNATALLLGDAAAANNTTLKNALTAAGLTTTQVDNGVTLYAGSPAASGFGVVLVMVGSSYGPSPVMPVAGQTAIVSAQTAGAGVLFTEWASYTAQMSYWTVLNALPLWSWSTSTSGTITYTLTSANHPIWTGLPGSFSTSVSIGVLSGASLIHGGTQIASASLGNGVAVKDPALPTGRTVHLPHSGNATAGWVNDANLVKMYTNAARWAARCP